MPQPSLEEIIKVYNLSPHPEGGFFRETYRSAGIIPTGVMPGITGNRNFCTAILYLLREGDRSSLHRIKQDEVWHYYLGAPIRLVMFSPAGVFSEVVVGPDIRAGQHLQYVVPAHTWFGAKPLGGAKGSNGSPDSGSDSDPDYSLAGCTVAPGFDFEDFKLGEKERLLRLFPAQKDIVEEFTP